MKRLISVVIVSILFFAVALFIIPRYSPSELLVPIVKDQMPGNRVPTRAVCYATMGTPSYCEDGPVAYNQVGNTITYTSVGIPNATIGQLLTLWGRPIGVIYSQNSTAVYWENRSAYVVSQPYFAPKNIVLVISYFQPGAIVFDNWTGFRRMRW